MNGISTHVLDTARGRPAAGVLVTLEYAPTGGEYVEIARGTTDGNGRIGSLSTKPPAIGDYRICFDTMAYFRQQGDPVFYPKVVAHIRLDVAGGGYHLPLLLSPFGYSTYRGS
jgi:5-hydroxyisourate hydrolase